ncbi:MAG: urease accessory protein UreF [Pseudomonadota bacterium]
MMTITTMITGIIMVTATHIIMDSGALYRLMTWLSPSYPVGAFSYSHGLEWDVEEGRIHDAASLIDWLRDIVELGGGFNDAVLLAHAWRAAECGDDAALLNVIEYVLAFAGTAERRMETAHQGRAFCDVTCRTWGAATLTKLMMLTDEPIAYPVAVGVAASDHEMALMPVLEAYGHGFAANLISAGIRLVPLGHSDGQRVTMAIEPYVAATAARAAAGDLTQMMSTTIMADMASMKHETQYTRLFRT